MSQSVVEQHFTVVIKDFIQYHYFLYRYGSGSGPIWLDDVGCTGSQTCLLSCSNRGIGSHNCGHSEDVAISCSGTRLLSADCSFIRTSKHSTVLVLWVGNLLAIIIDIVMSLILQWNNIDHEEPITRRSV